MQVPITYVTEMSWVNELMKLAPTILLIAGYVWFTRKAMGGLGGMGGPGGSRGGMGGIFSVGKAPVRGLLPAITFPTSANLFASMCNNQAFQAVITLSCPS